MEGQEEASFVEPVDEVIEADLDASGREMFFCKWEDVDTDDLAGKCIFFNSSVHELIDHIVAAHMVGGSCRWSGDCKEVIGENVLEHVIEHIKKPDESKEVLLANYLAWKAEQEEIGQQIDEFLEAVKEDGVYDLA